MPDEIHQYEGPQGVALVRAYDDGRTQPGWGLIPPDGSTEGFMPRYMRGEFLERKALHSYSQGRSAFAFVMRSLRLLCVDIDGKNNGTDGAKALSPLPPTLAETSKSGNGWHLFYWVNDDWDDAKGFGRLADRLGLKQGVDIRVTGCVFHYPQQRWNNRSIAELPHHLYDALLHREEKLVQAQNHIADVLATNDDLEVMMLQDELLTELKKPIKPGTRNVTLFAIGNKMRQAQVPDWEEHLKNRAHAVGLDQVETTKLVANIKRYGS